MNNLAVKEVQFNGDTLMACEKEDKIYVAVKWVCEGIGLTKGQMQSERKKVKEDLVISKGERNLVPPYEWRNARDSMHRTRLLTSMVNQDFNHSQDERG